MEFNSIKSIILAVGISLTITACSNEVSTNKSSPVVEEQNVSSIVLECEDFVSRLKNEAAAQLVDVRTPKEFENGNIEGSINLNLIDGSLENGLDNLDKNQPVYVYCAVGGRSAKAARLLEEKGFSNIIDLKGGYTAYSEYNAQK